MTQRMELLDLPEEITKETEASEGGFPIYAMPSGYEPRPAWFWTQLKFISERSEMTTSTIFGVSVASNSQARQPLAVSTNDSFLLCRVNEILPRPEQAFRQRLNPWVSSQLDLFVADLPRKLD